MFDATTHSTTRRQTIFCPSMGQSLKVHVYLNYIQQSIEGLYLQVFLIPVQEMENPEEELSDSAPTDNATGGGGG